MSFKWGELNRDELARVAPQAVTVVPVGSIEQHGHHIAVSSDTAKITLLAERACAEVSSDTAVLLTPTQCFGASDHHLPYGATLSLTTQTLRTVLMDIVRSIAKAGCRRVLLLNGHGGNAATCGEVAPDGAREYGIIVATASAWQLVQQPPEFAVSPGHAGACETSVLLAVAPDLVQMDRARPPTSPLPRSLPGLLIEEPDLWERIDGLSDDPRDADAEVGRRLFEASVTAVATAIREIASR